MTYYFRRSILPSHLITHQVMFLQPQKFLLRKSNPVLFQSSLSKSYTNFSPSSQKDSTFFSHYMKKSTKATIEQFSAVIIAKFIVTGIISYLLVDLIYARYKNRRNERLLNNTIEKGNQPDLEFLETDLISRPEIIERLKVIFQPHKDQSYYHIVCEEHGTGKTTLTRIASREAGAGVIYFDVPVTFEKFAKEFAKTINFSFEKHISFKWKILGYITDKSTYPKWIRVMDAFKRASAVYKAKYGKPPVIIYNNISRLVHKDKGIEMLITLQDDAKDNADH
ncbi:hypothetical protein C1645_817493 [Glomus cerebriforme]|uniref:ATPase AAA-type core domain-containing protein n=1 Tax=Glomus cerebriforme TaxID=658196 RepID=A0A397TIW7_9GLOM|nr:hypothetical protein C1645_817493 [Glomus cerebriforme]